MFFRSARGITGSWGHNAYGSNVPEYRPQHRGRTPIEQMAAQNGWAVLHQMPAYDDGSPIDLSGGPFAPGHWHPGADVVHGQAGYWHFWALTVTARTRGDNWRPYAVTFMQVGGVLPYVHVYPEGWRASLTSVMPEVHLESGEFNDRFATFARDAQTAYGLLNPRAMQTLIDSPPLDEIWTAGQFVCAARVDPHCAETLGAHLTLLTTIAGGVPSSLYERD
ncbi:DUF3137 domain-containing protein [Blastococcus sp. Marseille-P5729]|uniref:DUF3137 domain-containing protein n=1 Tax=Blastococcus sp. Marseille-P5729 TaxID=2086582 RepID=UPI000D104C16|nr:DUF3137 domain-containing protein [Blastococcus sp. Marseille-P5729]